ncbi:MAG: AAA family ATPase [Rhodospirillales bacterium]
MIVGDQSEVVHFLSRPASFGAGVAEVRRIETHVSVVFLAGDRAFKLKRAVRFPYLDFSTLELRRKFCDAEVRINRRTAPQIYRRVVAVTRERDGGLALDGHGAPVEWLVEMVRFDEDRLLDRMAQRGLLDVGLMETVADAVARFHAEAEERPNAGGPIAIGRIIDNNARCFAECPPDTIDAGKVRRLMEATRRALGGCIVLLGERSVAGFVRHCHGDMHLRNIFLDGDRPVLFDAIEFSAGLADIDVLYDLAFLLMDLQFRDLRRPANVLLNRYLDITGDTAGLRALPLFLALRATIRSHVDAIASVRQSDRREAEALRGAARRYLDLAGTFLAPHAPRLVAVGGLSGSGKSVFARDLAPFLGGAVGARVVRSDCTRKRLAGVAPTSPLGPEAYTPERDRQTYRAVVEEVDTALAAGHSVIADAVFARPGQRREIAAVAGRRRVPFQGFWLEAPPDVMADRIACRRGSASDATVDVLRAQLAYDVGQIDWTRLDASGPPDQVLAAGLASVGAATPPSL